MLRVSVPASSANLGPAFDCVAIAFNIRMQARATQRAGLLKLRFSGEESPAHSGIADCIRRGMSLVTPEVNKIPLEVWIDNDIPVGVGLGSSAAALICGIVLAAAAKNSKLTARQIVSMAAQVEGHADNAAAAVLGGICFVLDTEEGVAMSVLPPPRGLRTALVVPSVSLKTSYARSVLPRSYDRSDVVHNLQRATTLAVALARGNVQSAIAALDDRLHEPYRAPLVPGVAAALREKNRTTGVVLSGSGPSILILTTKSPSAAAQRVARRFRAAGIQTRVMLPRIDASGLVVKGRLRALQ